MLIIIVEFATSAADRAAAVEVLLAERPIVRSLSGNLGYTVRIDPESAGGISLTHEWTDAASFAAYRQTEGFTAVETVLFPRMVGAPVTRILEASLQPT